MALVMVNSNLKAVLFFGFLSPTPTDAVAWHACRVGTTGLINRGVKLSKGTHNADSIIESKAIYYLKYCGLRV
jgi:hypothetical protein